MPPPLQPGATLPGVNASPDPLTKYDPKTYQTGTWGGGMYGQPSLFGMQPTPPPVAPTGVTPKADGTNNPLLSIAPPARTAPPLAPPTFGSFGTTGAQDVFRSGPPASSVEPFGNEPPPAPLTVPPKAPPAADTSSPLAMWRSYRNRDYGRSALGESSAGALWNTANQFLGGVPAAVTNVGSEAVSRAIPDSVKRLATTPLDPRNRKVRIGENLDDVTGGGFSRTVSPEIAGAFNVGSSPLELFGTALPFLRGARAATGARVGGAAETAAAKAAPVPKPSPNALPGAPPPPPYTPYVSRAKPVPDGTPASNVLPKPVADAAPVPVASPAAAAAETAAAKAAPARPWFSLTEPGMGQSTAEIVSGVGALTNPLRVAYHLGRKTLGREGAGTAAGQAFQRAIPSAIVPGATAAASAQIRKETPTGYEARMLNPTAALTDIAQGLGDVANPSRWVNIPLRAALPAALGAGTVANQITGGNAPNLNDYFKQHWGNLGDVGNHLTNNFVHAMESVGRGAKNVKDMYTAGQNVPGNEIDATKDITARYRALHDEFLKSPNYLNNPEALAKFQQGAEALRAEAGKLQKPLNPQLAAERLRLNEAYRRAQASSQDPVFRDSIQRSYDAQLARLESLNPQKWSPELVDKPRLPFVSEGDINQSYWDVGRLSPRDPTQTPKTVHPEALKAFEDNVNDELVKLKLPYRQNVGSAGGDVAALSLNAATSPDAGADTPTDAAESAPGFPAWATRGFAPISPLARDGTPLPTNRFAPLNNGMGAVSLPIAPPAYQTERQGDAPSPVGVARPDAAPLAPQRGMAVGGGVASDTADYNPEAASAGANIDKMIRTAGSVGALMAGVQNAQPPDGLRQYWDKLDDSSKVLAIGGLSLAAIMTLKRMFSSEDDDDEGFLSKVLPLLGVGVGAYGLGGGTLWGDKGVSLPTWQNYKNFGNAAMTTAKSLTG